MHINLLRPMKKIFILLIAMTMAVVSRAQNTPASQMEKLGRGLVVVPASGGGELVTWRLLGTEDDEHTTFTVLRDCEPVATDIKARLTAAR